MAIISGQTDAVLKVKLVSQIVSARWGLGQIAAGGIVPVEVATQYVAEGSDIKITIKDGEGNAIDNLAGKVYANLFRARYQVAKPNKTGFMFFEAELSAHSLKGVSPKIKVGPPVKITDLKFLDEEGKELKQIVNPDSLELRAKIEGPPDGTPCNLSLYLRDGTIETLAYVSRTEVRDGKASCIWAFQPPSKEPVHPVQEELDKDGDKYRPLFYFFQVECLGARVDSEPVPYVSWVDMDFGNLRGKVVLILPDGSEVTKDIPDDGVVKLESPGAGKILLKDVQIDAIKAGSGDDDDSEADGGESPEAGEDAVSAEGDTDGA
jgi:hypothetical protein